MLVHWLLVDMDHGRIEVYPIVEHVEYHIRPNHAPESNKLQPVDRHLLQNRIFHLNTENVHI